ncbi:5'-methylthioadenosine/S-adenosylhomocysteine nucleosidase [Nocardia sp. NRRL S-836]|uniref:5'-methylthioadenosine/S-adenosylhomocysteine nucleosidase family protein n=1 Tax=Nocardia sp. NRRL S-836 TaxID=1519492 RepID=UPI0006ADB469|nr:5'-methylthioadenosine/S-adenosylhomocysteine nucleosidase [Nocardia sp. NRRL S-836]
MIVVLTATEAAHGSVRALLSGPRVHEGPAGTLYDVGEVAGRPVALALVGKGNSSAATLTERAIGEFSPSSAFFVGEAGALHSWVEPGDVVVATKVYGYHGGREDAEGFKARPDAWPAPYRLEQQARRVARSFSAQVHFAPIAAGELLLGPGSSTAAVLDANYNDAAAVDTESAGAAGAAHLNDATPVLTVRSIGTPAPAAAFVAALVAELPAEPGSRPQKERTVVHNVHHGDSHGVVIQAGSIHGGVHNHGAAAPAEPDLDTALTAAAKAGLLDESTYFRVMLALHEMKARPSDPAPRGVVRDLLSGHPELRRQLEGR